MIPGRHLLAFALLSLTLIIVPGPPRRLEIIGATGGMVLIGVGTRLALTGRSD